MTSRAVFAAILACLVLVSCSRELEPEKMVSEFFDALSRGDFTQAKQFAEPRTAAYLDLAAAMAEVRKVTGEILGLPEEAAQEIGQPRQLDDSRMEIPVSRDGIMELIPLIKTEDGWRIRLPESLF